MNTTPFQIIPIGKPSTGRVIVFDKCADSETLVSALGGEPLPQGPVLFNPLLTRVTPAARPILAALDVADAFGIAGVRS